MTVISSIGSARLSQDNTRMLYALSAGDRSRYLHRIEWMIHYIGSFNECFDQEIVATILELLRNPINDLWGFWADGDEQRLQNSKDTKYNKPTLTAIQCRQLLSAFEHRFSKPLSSFEHNRVHKASFQMRLAMIGWTIMTSNAVNDHRRRHGYADRRQRNVYSMISSWYSKMFEFPTDDSAYSDFCNGMKRVGHTHSWDNFKYLREWTTMQAAFNLHPELHYGGTRFSRRGDCSKCTKLAEIYQEASIYTGNTFETPSPWIGFLYLAWRTSWMCSPSLEPHLNSYIPMTPLLYHRWFIFLSHITNDFPFLFSETNLQRVDAYICSTSLPKDLPDVSYLPWVNQFPVRCRVPLTEAPPLAMPTHYTYRPPQSAAGSDSGWQADLPVQLWFGSVLWAIIKRDGPPTLWINTMKHSYINRFFTDLAPSPPKMRIHQANDIYASLQNYGQIDGDMGDLRKHPVASFVTIYGTDQPLSKFQGVDGGDNLPIRLANLPQSIRVSAERLKDGAANFCWSTSQFISQQYASLIQNTDILSQCLYRMK